MKKMFLIAVLALLALAVALTGCSEKTYRVDYCGQQSLYSDAEDSYAAGEEVTVYFTDVEENTAYRFLLDGKEIVHKEKRKGLEVSFTMPNHDVKLQCEQTAASDGQVYVSTPQEFLEAIAPGAKIVVEPGYYNLSEYIETAPANWNKEHPYVKLQECYDGMEVIIQDVEDLEITARALDTAETEIVVDPRYAGVLTFSECEDLTLNGLTMGHTDMGECSGNVLNFYDCENISLHNMDLYGCGVFGIQAGEGTKDMYVSGCLIRDCYDGPIYLADVKGSFVFRNCTLSGSLGCGYYDASEDSYLEFYNCTFGLRESEGFYFREDIYTDNCKWVENFEYYPEY